MAPGVDFCRSRDAGPGRDPVTARAGGAETGDRSGAGRGRVRVLAPSGGIRKVTRSFVAPGPRGPDIVTGPRATPALCP
ncbi:hypothetical protein AU375_04574 [Methylobacterium radiotolerans]|nr:hypothetical protein AU375_04574 [Methylobacterium radiotolerans]